MLRTTTLSILVILSSIAFPSIAFGQTEDEVEDWFDRADGRIARGRWNRALPMIEKVVAARPEDDEARGLLLLCLRATGRWEKAVEVAAKHVQAAPDDKERVVDYAEFLRDLGRDDEALAVLEASMKTGGDYRVEATIGSIHVARGRDEAARKVFDGLVERAKRDIVKAPRDLTGLARAYRSFPHGGDAAEKALVEAQKRDKKYLPAYIELATIYGRLKVLPSDMVREFKDALDIRRRWPAFLIGQAKAYDLRLGRAEGQRNEAVDLVLKINPNHPDALYFKAMDQIGDAQWKDAGVTLEKALAVNSNHADVNAARAALAWVTHDEKTWKELEARALERDPTNGRFYRIVAQSLNDRRRWGEALEMMRKAVAIDDKSAALYDDLARYAFYVGQNEEGIKALDRAVDLDRYGRVWRNNMSKVSAALEERYKVVETPHFRIKLHRRDFPVLRHYVPNYMERSWAELVERYRFAPTQPVQFEMLLRHADFSVRTMGTLGLGATGVCFGPTVYMISPREKALGAFCWASTAHHEFAHVVTLQLSRGRVPRWLTEGLSSYEEIRRNPAWGRNHENDLFDAYHNDKIFDVLAFDGGFRGPRISFAYYQGGLTCEFMEQTYGWDAVLKMLRLYGEDKLTADVLREALEVEPEEFDRAFLAWVEKRIAPIKRIPRWDDDSIKRFRTAIDEGRDVDEHRIKLAWAYFQRGRQFDADEILAPLTTKGVEDPRIDILLGLRANVAKRRDLAREKFEAALAKGSENFDLLLAMARLAWRADETAKTIDFYERAAKSHPWFVDARRSPYVRLAEIYEAEGDQEAWARVTEAFCGLVDNVVDRRLKLAKYHERKGNLARSLELLGEINEVQPLDLDLHLLRGRLMVKTSDAIGAKREFEVALELAPKPPQEAEARLALAKLYQAEGQTEEALDHVDRVLEIDANNVEALNVRRQLER